MQLRSLFHNIFKSLNPDSYAELKENSIADAFKYFFFITILSLIIMFILFIPALIGFPGYVASKASNFDRLDVNFSFSLQKPFNLLDDPLIRVAPTGENLTSERMLITPEGLYYKSFLLFGKEKSVPLKEGMDLKKSAGQDASSLLLFLLPSIILWSVIIFSFYFIIIIVLTFLIAYLFVWAFKLHIRGSSMFKCAIYAATIMIVVQLLLMPFYRLFLIPLMAYWILLLIVILLFKDETSPHGSSRVNVDDSPKNIFKQDHVDADEHGNLAGPKKRKKSFDEENEGYVELK